MRGTRAVCDGESCRIRIIPAYAGNTGLVHVRHSGNGDHPRVCGEHCGVCGAYFSCLGSSPRMRGTPSGHIQTDTRLGIIPAYAGNTISHGVRYAGLRDHPRVCGEHLDGWDAQSDLKGSSPRMRGTPSPAVCGRSRSGIIPAYAGNTAASPSAGQIGRDHPRVCGEHRREPAPLPLPVGSSPRMRGTRFLEIIFVKLVGIIPAYAGNTRIAVPSRHCRWDHPRVCGEHLSTVLIYVITKGSSPRMRGTLCLPSVLSEAMSRPRDHPRVCGEHRRIPSGRCSRGGSSPRMRGTRNSADG